jgi:membrane peptidoglycan carboxypeptidase
MVGQRIGPEDREPELLTHHQHNGTGVDADGYDAHWSDDEEQSMHEPGLDDGYDDYDDEDTEYDEDGKPTLTPAQRKTRRWRRVRRTLYAMAGLFIVLPALAFTIAYFLVDVPSPKEVAESQNKVITYYYANGDVLGKDFQQGGNRQLLKPEDIPDVVKHAVYAAEDATFETNPGFDVTGIMRAVWNQATGGVGGGSTISQQYIKKATENDDATITRKFFELVKSFKMNNEQDKRDIITAYLNTIYFGRGAYGIQTASQAYFGKDVKDLGAAEAAVLAGIIQAPSRSDDPDYVERRWNFVMDQMVDNKWLPKAERDSAQVPEMIPEENTRPDQITGPNKHIRDRVLQELAAHGYPEEKVQSGGFNVYTTIDPGAQAKAVDAVNEVMQDQPAELRKALVAVNPRTGGIVAYYGGPADPKLDARDWANTQRNPGSAFKAFDLVALLQRGKGLGETYDGRSERMFPGREQPVSNAGPNSSCGPNCTVAEAMKVSANTVFYDMVLNDTGVQGVKDAALAAGIPEKHGKTQTMPTPDGNIAIGGGDVAVTPQDMATAYATFAAEGVHRDSHFVARVEESDGTLVYETPVEEEMAFSDDEEKNKQIAGNVTESLEPVLPFADLDCAGNRDCAGKTGTHQYVASDGRETDENAQAWMVGYTPQISTTTWVGTGVGDIIQTASGQKIYGSGLPGEIWQKFMNSYLEGKPELEFPKVDLIGKPIQPDPPPSPQQRERETKPAETTDPTTTTPESTEPSETDIPDSSGKSTEPDASTGNPEESSDFGIFPPGRDRDNERDDE